MSDKKPSLGKVLAAGTILAAGAGYLAGILTAPKSGKETRADIAKNASKARVQGEKQLKNLHSEVDGMIKDAEKLSKAAQDKAGYKLKEAKERAQVAKDKGREILSALHHGDADDPNLQAVIEELKLAKNNLAKFIKK